MPKLLLSFILAFCSFSAFAQGVTWSVDFNTVFENREGGGNLAPDKTVFFTRLSPQVGLSMLDGKHNIVGGASWKQPVSNSWNDYKISPTLFYHYQTPELRMSFGMFPRTQLIEPLPTVFLSDSMAYNEPNIRGFLLQYVHPKGYAELALDWRSQQTETQREAFNVNFNGEWRPQGILLVGGHALVNHLAKQKNPPEGQGVNDDIMANPYVGLNLARHTPLDSFVIKTGAIVALERARADNAWHTPAGVLIDVVAEWRAFGVKEVFFAGKNLYPLYPRFGNLLNLGDPYFQTPVYSRTNVYAYIFRNQFVNFMASLDFHVSKEELGFWQSLKLRVYMDDKLWKKRNIKTTKGEYLRNVY